MAWDAVIPRAGTALGELHHAINHQP